MGKHCGGRTAVRLRRAVARKILIVTAIIIVLPVVTFFSLPLLLSPSEVMRADCIIHSAIDSRLNGDNFVAQLYTEGVASKIVCISSQASWDVYPADFAREHLIELGVRASDITALRLPMVECGAQFRPLVVDHLRKNGWKSALLVADPSITRVSRSGIISHFRKAGIDVAITFAPKDREDMLDRWWRTHWKAQRVVLGIMNSTLDMLYPSCR